MPPDERSEKEQALIAQIWKQHPELLKRLPWGWTADEWLVLAIIRPQHVVYKWHLIVQSHELREEARKILHEQRTNYLGEEGILVICPVR